MLFGARGILGKFCLGTFLAKEYEHWPEDLLKNKRPKLHMQEFSFADKAIGRFACAGERIPRWNYFPFSRQIFPGDLRYGNQVTFFVSLTSFGDKKTFSRMQINSMRANKTGRRSERDLLRFLAAFSIEKNYNCSKLFHSKVTRTCVKFMDCCCSLSTSSSFKFMLSVC